MNTTQQIELYAQAICFKLGNNADYKYLPADKKGTMHNVLLITQGDKDTYFYSRETYLRSSGFESTILTKLEETYNNLK